VPRYNDLPPAVERVGHWPESLADPAPQGRVQRSLGTFVEIEAIDRDGGLGETRLREQCERYRQLLGIEEADLEARSYGDLLRGR